MSRYPKSAETAFKFAVSFAVGRLVGKTRKFYRIELIREMFWEACTSGHLLMKSSRLVWRNVSVILSNRLFMHVHVCMTASLECSTKFRGLSPSGESRPIVYDLWYHNWHYSEWLASVDQEKCFEQRSLWAKKALNGTDWLRRRPRLYWASLRTFLFSIAENIDESSRLANLWPLEEKSCFNLRDFPVPIEFEVWNWE